MKQFISGIILSTVAAASFGAAPSGKHFNHMMVVMFENMSYAEIKNEPTFKRLVEYTGSTLTEEGRLLKLTGFAARSDANGNGYAFFSNYYNNHTGGDVPSRTSQSNYIAMTSGSTQGVTDNESYDLNADNLAIELMEAGLSWKVYADDLPDPKAPSMSGARILNKWHPHKRDYVADPSKTEQENDQLQDGLIAKEHHDNQRSDYHAVSGCFIGKSNNDGAGASDDGYMRKHEPFISYLNIQSKYDYCKNIVNSKHLVEDLGKMPNYALYIPNQINDGHNGSLKERVVNANAFLSKMMGADPKTGLPLPNAKQAPFQRFMEDGGLLMITFDEPSTTGNPDKTIYAVFAGKMIHSGVYPNEANSGVCYPPESEQTTYVDDKHGKYAPLHCNHYNLLKMMEANWGLRGLNQKTTSAGYRYAYPTDVNVKGLWK